MENNSSPIARNQSSLKVVWLALVLAMLAYTVVGFVFSAAEPPDSKENTKKFFLIGGAFLGIISLLIFKFTLSRKSLRKKFLATQGQEEQKRLDDLSSSLLLPHVVPWGINESIVLLGFVLSFISKNPVDIAPFSTLGAALQIYMYPRTEHLIKEATETD